MIKNESITKTIGMTLLLLGASTLALAAPPPTNAPEIDPGSAVSALALLSGTVLMVRSRRKQ